MEPSDDRPVLRARGIGDILGLLGVLLGFHPRDSLLVVALDGPRSRLGPCGRIDVPAAEEAEPVASMLAGQFARNGAERVLVIAVCADPRRADPLLAAVTARCRAAGIEVLEVVRADAGRYWCYGPAGRPTGRGGYYDDRSSPLLAEAVLAGQPVLADREALAATLAPVAGQRRTAMREVTGRVVAEIARWERSHRPEAAVHRGAIRVRRILEGEGPLSDEDCAAVSVWVDRIAVRDAVGARFEPSSARREVERWREVARRVVPPFEPAVLSLTGYAAWMAGDGALARIAAERALRADGGYAMARRLHELLDAAVPPPGSSAALRRAARRGTRPDS